MHVYSDQCTQNIVNNNKYNIILQNLATILQYTILKGINSKSMIFLSVTHNMYLNTGYEFIYKV